MSDNAAFLPPRRPLMAYYGGKWRIAKWVAEHFPEHRVYTEAFCGAASVLMRKPKSCVEILNDVDGEVVNLFRVLRDPASARALRFLLHCTPLSRADFMDGFCPAGEPVEQARRMLTRAFLGHGSSSSVGTQSGFGVLTIEAARTRGQHWQNIIDDLPRTVNRLRQVLVENLPATQFLKRFDAPDALHYVDPPYPLTARSCSQKMYRNEMSQEDHRALGACLRELQGAVVISGYACPLYDEELFPDWKRVERRAYSIEARPRTEVVWIKPR